MGTRRTIGGRGSCLLYLGMLLLLALAVALAVIVFIVAPERARQQQAEEQRVQATVDAQARAAQATATVEARTAEVQRAYDAGVAFAAAGDWEKAAEEFARVVALAPGYKDATTRLAETRTSGIESAYQRGLGFFNAERWEQARAEFERVIAINPNYKDVQAKLAEVEAKQAEARALTPTVSPVPTATHVPPKATHGTTPTTASTPELALLFFDDFDAGPKPDWEILSGRWGMAGGKYTLTDISDSPVTGVSVVGETAWRDYVIETNVSGLDNGNGWRYSDKDRPPSRAAILVRVQGNGSAVGLMIDEEFLDWEILEGDGWTVVPGTRVDGYGEEGTRIKIQVRGNVYGAYVDGKMLTSFSDDRFPSGKVGLWLKSSGVLDASDWRAVPKVDNFRVTRLD
jgi:tetratricopeptide (TPR) repeat protein